MTTDDDSQLKTALRDQTLAVLGGALKTVHENGITLVNYFGARSDVDHFTLADLRYAVAFKRAYEAGRPPPTTINTLPPGEEEAFQAICRELIEQGLLLPSFSEYQDQEFRVRLVPSPFDQDWQFVRQLGGGGQSRTIEVLHKNRRARGVLKVLAPSESAEEEVFAKERFRREVAELNRINHRAIASLLEFNVDEHRGEFGYVTRLGIPLEKYWSQTAKSLPPAELYARAYHFVRRLAEGLTEVHKLGVVHRDLKPDNVIVVEEQPVIIDFGLVTNARYEAANLTDAHGRQVGNHFNPPAVYGLDDADPRRDVAALGWLYGFLLGEPVGGKRRPQRFHWQSHNLVPEARAERARAILAACSLRGSIPTSAEEFCAMMDRLFLGEHAPAGHETGRASREKAEQVHAEKEAKEILDVAAEREQVDFAVQLFAEPLADLRMKLKELCVGSDRLPITQYDDNRSHDPETDFLLNPAPNVPMDGIMREAHRRVAYSYGEATSSEQRFFHCHCGRNRRFEVSASLHYSRMYRGDALNFTLYLLCVPDFADRKKWRDAAFTLYADGTIRNMDGGQTVSTADIAALGEQWCFDEQHWAWL